MQLPAVEQKVPLELYEVLPAVRFQTTGSSVADISQVCSVPKAGSGGHVVLRGLQRVNDCAVTDPIAATKRPRRYGANMVRMWCIALVYYRKCLGEIDIGCLELFAECDESVMF